MKCPNKEHKGKTYELKTLRTLANGTSVKRERYCPKCQLRYTTFEEFETNLQRKEEEHRKEHDDLENKYYAALSDVRKHREVLKLFKSLLDTADSKQITS